MTMKSLTRASLETPRGADSLRLRWLMNEQQRLEIGRRLRELRDNSPETNRSIGDYVGVAERTVAEWASGRQGITYDNAKKVAGLFEVDLDWFWRGKERATSDGLLDALTEAQSSPVLAAVRELDRKLEALRVELLAELGQIQNAQEGQHKRPVSGGRKRGAK